MTPNEIDTILNANEVVIGFGSTPDLRETRFWSAVAAVKKDPALVEPFSDRIGAIDHAAHASWARLVIPLRVGTMLAVVAAFLGVVIVAVSISTDLSFLADAASLDTAAVKGIAFLVGTGVLIGSTHGLGHLAVGTIVGIRFTGWFIGRGRPQPGVKTDYGSYLRASPRSRAWMHASGAIVTKAVPFVLLPAALLSASIPGWVSVLLVLVGVVQVVTDVVWSTKASDWAKFQREMTYASVD